MSSQKANPETGAPVRVLLVDDHPLLRRGVRAMINNEPDMEVCGEATDGPEGLTLIRSLCPDLAVVDITLPSGHGLDLIKEIRQHDTHIKLLVLSMHDEGLYAERVVRAGANGYINKSEAIDSTIEAIRQVNAGKVYLSSAMTQRMLHSVSPQRPTGREPGECLSDRELMVFERIGQGQSSRIIAEHLHLSIKTIETYKEHIKSKLHLKDSAELSSVATRWVLLNQEVIRRPEDLKET